MTELENTNNPAISPELARVTLQFLQRASLQGAEMPAYVEVFNCLSAVAQQDQKAPPAANPTKP